MTSAIKGVVPIKRSKLEERKLGGNEFEELRDEKRDAVNGGKDPITGRDLFERMLDALWLMPF